MVVPTTSNAFDVLKLQFPLHAILARLTAKDGLSFYVFSNSIDLRLSIEARLKNENIHCLFPKSHNTIKDYVMKFGESAVNLLKRVLVYAFPFIFLK
jgi:hypothetical protein